MAENTKIEWTDVTWNPITGCKKISHGCFNCYAERMAKRLRAMGHPKYKNGFEVTIHLEDFMKPFEWKKPRKVFVCSMGDIFHHKIHNKYLRVITSIIKANPHHIFQILTKRPQRLHKSRFLKDPIVWPSNTWIGITAVASSYVSDLRYLKNINNNIRYVSFEPLLEHIDKYDLTYYINKTYVDWVIVGGESGPGARPMHPDWVRDIRDQCISQSIPFFFKQWGGVNKKKTGRLLDGRTWDEMPGGLR